MVFSLIERLHRAGLLSKQKDRSESVRRPRKACQPWLQDIPKVNSSPPNGKPSHPLIEQKDPNKIR